jgi:hypothetical protein
MFNNFLFFIEKSHSVYLFFFFCLDAVVTTSFCSVLVVSTVTSLRGFLQFRLFLRYMGQGGSVTIAAISTPTPRTQIV